MASTSDPRPDVQALFLGLTKRVRADASWAHARVRFDLGGEGSWGLMLDGGLASVTAGRVERPDATIRTTGHVLEDMYDGRRHGYEAFLDGEVDVRGNLSLALELESWFEPTRTLPADWPRTIHVKAGKARWSIFVAGAPEAPPVFLFHGLGATKASMLTTVRALAATHRVYACDEPGFGDSSKPVASYDAGWFAARVHELLDELGITDATLIGNSMGGRISIETALRHPERVRSIVLFCPALAFVRYRQLAPLVRLLRPEIGFVPIRPRRSTVLFTLRGIFAHPERLPASWYEGAADEFFRVYGKPRGRHAFLAAARHIYLDEPHGEEGFWQRLAGLDVPSLFVFGRHDPLIPAAFARRVIEALPKAQVEIMEDCGHVPQLELPDQTHAIVSSFLAGV